MEFWILNHLTTLSKSRLHQSNLAFSSALLEDSEQGELGLRTVHGYSEATLLGEIAPEAGGPTASYRRPSRT
jgi:hypothetical protein